MIEGRFAPATAAVAAVVKEPTTHKWLARYVAHGVAGLRHASSRPRHSPRSIREGVALAIVFRRKRLTQVRIEGPERGQRDSQSGAATCRTFPSVGYRPAGDRRHLRKRTQALIKVRALWMKIPGYA